MIPSHRSPALDRKNGRRGSALILTMIMLILIIVFFSSFTVMALYNHKNAKEGEALIQARLHCQTGLHSFYRDLSVQWAQPTSENIFPSSKSGQTNFFTPSSGDWAERFYWASADTDTNGIIKALHTPLAGVDFVPNSSLNGNVGWLHVIDPEGSGAIIARTCYLVIDESGKIDPSAVVDTAFVEGNEPFTGTTSMDISLLPLFSSAGFAQKFQPKGTGVGTMPDTAFWFSYFHILKTHPDALSGTNYKDVFRGTVFPFSEDIDAFNVYEEIGGNTVAKTKHRVDLTDIDWDGMENTIDSCVLDSETADFWDGSDINPIPEDGNGYPINGIPWIHNATDEEIKNHVLANLIDYCDSNNVPTTDDQLIPTYVGLEKVPYINEIGFTAEIQWIGNATTGSYHLVITTFPELINCYTDDFKEQCTLYIQIEVEGGDDLIPGILGTELDPRELEFDIAETVPERDYYFFEDSSGVHAEITANVQEIPLVAAGIWDDSAVGAITYLSGITITINSARLVNSSGELLDFAFDEASAPKYALDTAPGRIYSVSAEVNDPRYNLKESEWTWGSAWVMGITGTIGDHNSKHACNPESPSYDQEKYGFTDSTGTPPDTSFPIALDLTSEPFRGISTMYIRNDTMESPWELGCIHRGKPWETLNLTVFNDAETATEGMAEYSAGDANILDQVKIGDQITTTGRINVNTPYSKVIEALLANVTIGGTYEDSNRLDEIITANVAKEIAKSASNPVLGDWLFHNGSTGGKSGVTDVGGDPFHSRGQICQVTKLTDGTAYTPGNLTDELHQDTDMWREEIIGKMANLTTTRPNFFTVIIVAQTIKDMPDGFQGGKLGEYDDGVDKVLAEQKTMVILHRDGFDNQFKVLRLEYLE